MNGDKRGKKYIGNIWTVGVSIIWKLIASNAAKIGEYVFNCSGSG